MIKDDEVMVIATILKHCKKEYDMIPIDELYTLGIPYKRLMYLLEKFHWLEYGTSCRGSWLCQPAWRVIEYYKNVHGVEIYA